MIVPPNSAPRGGTSCDSVVVPNVDSPGIADPWTPSPSRAVRRPPRTRRSMVLTGLLILALVPLAAVFVATLWPVVDPSVVVDDAKMRAVTSELHRLNGEFNAIATPVGASSRGTSTVDDSCAA